ncbi:MAG TPA: DNA mismatch repair endonuclease MutL [Armatimonadota bacterium]|nr:DNA mismatch repair endonuclease MutL [Armatimonadota bacterium]
MGQINVLDDLTANRIAAGEVVERPASIVKELLENAIDAGGKRITVELADGGKRMIRVTDDGSGMDADDAVLSIQRFATSKIHQADDLAEIMTLGFRGEALPSIAAVSRFRIVTREHDADEGVELLVEGGEVKDIHTVGCPAGTMVEVTDLFYNTPARLKFLKVTNTERGHCVDWAQRLALCYPDIAFRVIHDDATIFVSPATGDLLPVLTLMYGASSARDFVPLSYIAPDMQITGYVSTPRLTRANRTHQHFFINGRFVRSRMMSHALGRAFGAILPSGRHPICSLSSTASPRFIDPNAHPTKIDVRFSRPWEVYDLVEQAASKALQEADMIGEASFTRHPSPEPESVTGGLFPRRVNPFHDRVDEHDEGIEVHGTEPTSTVFTPAMPATSAPAQIDLSDVRVLGQLRNTYIVAETTDAMVLINQHRASEQVLIERMRAGETGRHSRTQRLTVPVSVELSPAESGAVQDHLNILLEMGYELEPFGKSAWLIRAIPTFLEGRNYEEVLRGLAEDMSSKDVPPDIDARRELARATASCHAAIKAGDHLQPREAEQLVQDLAKTTSPGICPHGDPIIIGLPIRELDRRFER